MSFAKEIDDFVNTALAVRKSRREDENSRVRNDYYRALTQAALTKATTIDPVKAARIRSIGLRDKLAAARNAREEKKANLWAALTRARTDAARAKAKGDTAIPLIEDPELESAAVNRVVGRTPSPWDNVPIPGASAAPPSAPTGDEDEDGFDDEDEDRGGFASGGVVEPRPRPTQAIPLDDEAPEAERPQESAPGQSNSIGFSAPEALQSWRTATGVGQVDPVDIGLRAIQKHFSEGMTQGLPTHGNPIAVGLARNEGAATDEEVKRIDQVVDPNGELSESARMIARLDASVKFYANRGQMDKAAKLAHSLLLYGKMKSQQFGSLAAVALQNGDKDRAIKYLERAYDYIPDGKKLDAFIGQDGLIHARTIDEATGERTDLGAFGLQQVFRFTLGVANGQEYVNRMVALASTAKGMKMPKGVEVSTARSRQGRGDATKPAKSAKPMSVNERTSAAAEIESVADKFGLGEGSENPLAADIKRAATDIYATNNIDPRKAFHIVGVLSDPNRAKEFEIDTAKDGGVTVTTGDGEKYNLSRNTFAQLVALRGKAKKQMEAQSLRDAEERKVEEKRTALKKQRQEAFEADTARKRAIRTRHGNPFQRPYSLDETDEPVDMSPPERGEDKKRKRSAAQERFISHFNIPR